MTSIGFSVNRSKVTCISFLNIIATVWSLFLVSNVQFVSLSFYKMFRERERERERNSAVGGCAADGRDAFLPTFVEFCAVSSTYALILPLEMCWLSVVVISYQHILIKVQAAFVVGLNFSPRFMLIRHQLLEIRCLFPGVFFFHRDVKWHYRILAKNHNIVLFEVKSQEY